MCQGGAMREEDFMLSIFGINTPRRGVLLGVTMGLILGWLFFGYYKWLVPEEKQPFVQLNDKGKAAIQNLLQPK